MIDDSRNDIYLLVDKKSNLTSCKFHLDYSDIYYLNPINIYWGSYSQIEAELYLLRASIPGHYGYYHIVSGQDLPLVNQDKIHEFFNKHKHYEFIQYQKETIKEINDKLNPHLFLKHLDYGIDSEYNKLNFLCNILLTVYRHIEHIIMSRIKETKIPMSKVSTASTWMSIDNQLATIIVKSSDWIYSKFHKGKTVDELFIPTLINYYPCVLNKVYDRKVYKETPSNPMSNLRYIRKNSVSAHPKTWTMDNYNELKTASKQGYLFSRKFDINIDYNIVSKVFNDVMDS